MGSDSNGLTQTPYTQAAVPTPSATEGDQGIGGGFDADPGGSGLVQTPFTKAIVPTPTQMAESGPFGNPSRYASVGGHTFKGESFADDITPTQNRKVDRK